jgi:L-histidine Nalpha-methyltransferase
VDWTANIAVHESAAPEFLREQIILALKNGGVHPNLLYSGLRQASLWTALHHTISPAQRQENCVAMYDLAFQRVTELLRGNVANVVSLACGDGTKDVRCLREVRASTRAAIYTPADISVDLVLTAARHAASELRGLQSTPLVCDLVRCSVLPAILKSFDPSGAERIILFLGTIHNFWPPDVLRPVCYPLRSQDQLLLSANLAPATRYDDALTSILPQYENEPTRAWLFGALSELGISEKDGELLIRVEPSPEPGLKRIDAVFRLRHAKKVLLYSKEIELQSGQELRVFFSYRFTPEHVRRFVEQAGLHVAEQWVDASEQEGLFLCKRRPD